MGDDGRSAREAWDEVGEHFASLGKRVGEHYRSLDAGADQEAGVDEEAGTGSQAEADRRRLDDAVRTLTDRLDQAFTSVGNALRDPETRTAMDRAARSLGDALARTFSDVEQGIRRRAGRPRNPGEPPAGGGTSSGPAGDPDQPGSSA